MGKAMNTPIQNLSIEQAANHILTLIDRGAAPPSVDELKTILKRMA